MRLHQLLYFSTVLFFQWIEIISLKESLRGGIILGEHFLKFSDFHSLLLNESCHLAVLDLKASLGQITLLPTMD